MGAPGDVSTLGTCGGLPRATSGPYIETNVEGWGTPDRPSGGIHWTGDGYYCGQSPYSGLTNENQADGNFVGMTTCDETQPNSFVNDIESGKYGNDGQVFLQGPWSEDSN